MKLHDSLKDPPEAGKIVLGVWQRGGVPDAVSLVIKGSIEKNEWHALQRGDDGQRLPATPMNVIAFGPSHWIALEDMPPFPDRRGEFPKYKPRFSLFDHGWPAIGE